MSLAASIELLRSKDAEASSIKQQLERLVQKRKLSFGALNILVENKSIISLNINELSLVIGDILFPMEFDTSKSVEIETLNGLMTVQASLNDVVYSASLEFKEIPLDTHMDAELDLLPTSVEVEDSTQIKVKLTVSLDVLDVLIEAKERELAHIELEIRQISSEMQQDRVPPKRKATKGNTTKKSPIKNKTKGAGKSAFSVEEKASFTEGVYSTLASVWAMGLTHRAPLLFVASVAAIYLHGDVASL